MFPNFAYQLNPINNLNEFKTRNYYTFFFLISLSITLVNRKNNENKDCKVGEFSQFGACSATCGGGTQTRTRTVTQQPTSGGQGCPPLTETQGGNTQECPINCVVGEYQFGACSVTCGGGTQTKTRDVIRQPNSIGLPCPELEEQQQCNTQPCEIISLSNSQPIVFDSISSSSELTIQLNALQGLYDYKLLGMDYKVTYTNTGRVTAQLRPLLVLRGGGTIILDTISLPPTSESSTINSTSTRTDVLPYLRGQTIAINLISQGGTFVTINNISFTLSVGVL